MIVSKLTLEGAFQAYLKDRFDKTEVPVESLREPFFAGACLILVLQNSMARMSPRVAAKRLCALEDEAQAFLKNLAMKKDAT